ncbi:MAG: hypothetical protein U1F58_08475 [Burkholderiales bacterium]
MLLVAVIAAGAATWWRVAYVDASDVAGKLSAASRSDHAIDLARLTSFEWDRVVFLGPYTDRESAERALGTTWSDYPLLGLESADSFGVIVFLRGSRIAQVEKIDRCHPDFAKEILARPIARAAARFRFEPGKGCTTMVLA